MIDGAVEALDAWLLNLTSETLQEHKHLVLFSFSQSSFAMNLLRAICILL